MKKTVKSTLIIGGTSGIGYALAQELLMIGDKVAVCGRRVERLEPLKVKFGRRCFPFALDVTLPNALNQIESFAKQWDTIDCLIFCAGIGYLNPHLELEKEKATIDLNVVGFTKFMQWAITYFEKKGKGHLVNISSVAMHRGGKAAPAYNASKAYQSNYLEGLRQRAYNQKTNLIVTDIRPGFVDTAMAKGNGLFWVSSPTKAAKQIQKAITQKKEVAYVGKRWRVIGWILHLLPRKLYKRI